MKSGILDEADKLTAEDRHEDYGPYSEEAPKIAKMWSVIFGIGIEPRKVPLAMMAVKMVREAHKPKRDNRVDFAGYAKLMDEIIGDSS